LPELALVNVALTICAVLGQVQVPDDQVADVAPRVERLDEGVADDDQRDHGDEEVQGDHQGKVLAVDLVEPPDGFERERHQRAPLKSLLITPRAGDPLLQPSGAVVAPFAHRPSLR
jgi:hypothetical protein